ncbi:MAG: hypothetical protein ACRC3A_02240 [Culicoidibacterales bacterium]
MANTDIDFNNKLTNGQNIAYMIHPGVEYTQSIPNAVQKLMYPSGLTNNLVLNRTTNYTTSKLDFYQERVVNNINAYARVFRKNTAGAYYNSTSQMDSLDWIYGEVFLNDYRMVGYSNTVREAIIIHEMLHVYGCKDITNSASIMYMYTPLATGVTSDANRVLNNKY